MPPSVEMRATIEDLYGVEGKAELIDGRIVPIMASGDQPSEIAFEIAVSLRDYCRQSGRGLARGDGLGYAVPELSSGRQSFEPDASYFDGVRPQNRQRFIEGPPTFAIELRSEFDRGPAALTAIAAKRADYFEDGTKVVWDVDPVAEMIHCYRREGPTTSIIFRRGDIAHAEPAVPGWTMPVDAIFGG